MTLLPSTKTKELFGILKLKLVELTKLTFTLIVVVLPAGKTLPESKAKNVSPVVPDIVPLSVVAVPSMTVLSGKSTLKFSIKVKAVVFKFVIVSVAGTILPSCGLDAQAVMVMDGDIT